MTKKTWQSRKTIHSTLLFYSLFIPFGVHATADKSTFVTEKPRINFVGILSTPDGKETAVENCTIAGLYKQIPVYAKPRDGETDPSIDTTFIDFDEIAEIKTPFKEGEVRTSYTFKKRLYNEIIIITNNAAKTANHYLLEATRKLRCDEIDGNKRKERELSFLALKSLKITTFHEQEKESKKTASGAPEQTTAQKAICFQTQEKLKDLEKQPLDSKTSSLVNEIKDNVETLCRPS